MEWVSYISMELDATSLYVLRRHLDLAEVYGEAPVAVASARKYFERMICRAARPFIDGRTYLLGEQFTAADILLVSCDNIATWTWPQPLNTNAASDSGHDHAPQVTTDGLGHWVAVWQSCDYLDGTIGTD